MNNYTSSSFVSECKATSKPRPEDYNLRISSYLPMNWDGEDLLDVVQHYLEVLWILLKAHFCQHQRLADILDENKDEIIHLFYPLHGQNRNKKALLEQTENPSSPWWGFCATAPHKSDVAVTFHLLVLTL